MYKKIDERIPISDKLILTVSEATSLTGIGQNKLEKMLREPDCPFVIKNGNRRLIKRDRFISYINEVDSF